MERKVWLALPEFESMVENFMDENPIPPADQADHLFLLVGANALPNAVASFLLARHSGTITALHTAETLAAMKNLRAWLDRKRPDLSFRSFQVDKTDASVQYRVVAQAVAGISGEIGVHFTGGSKSMAVHLVRAFEMLDSEPIPRFSYLDSDSLEMIVEGRHPERGEKPARFHVGSVKIGDLEGQLHLHGWQIVHRQAEPPLIRTAQRLARMAIETPQNMIYWANAGKKYKWNLGSRIADDQQFIWPTNQVGEEIGAVLSEEVQISRTEEVTWKEISSRAGFEGVADFARWLTGSWLESLALQGMLDACNRLPFVEASMNVGLWDLKNPGRPRRAKDGAAKDHTEIDVLALAGYQVYALSCAVFPGGWGESHAKHKVKLFEIRERARQLGGAEARAGLVCLSENPAVLAQELSYIMATGWQFRVFGLRDLLRLGEQFEEWIRKENGLR